MDNQHKKISGYRDLTQEEIDMMNRIKSFGPLLQELIEDLLHANADPRWVSIGKTNIQQGLMALARAVAQPESF